MTDLSPQEKRAVLAESYRKSYLAVGVPMDPKALEDLVVRDLELVDAAERAGEITAQTAPTGPYVARPPRDPVKQAAADAGLRLDPDGETIEFRETDQNPGFTSKRWAMAAARISRILEGAGGSSNLDVAIANAAHPALAREYVETWWYFMTRDQLPIVGRNDHNPFRGMSDRDALRLLVRRVEDICDKSTGKFGGWYVR